MEAIPARRLGAIRLALDCSASRSGSSCCCGGSRGGVGCSAAAAAAAGPAFEYKPSRYTSDEFEMVDGEQGHKIWRPTRPLPLSSSLLHAPVSQNPRLITDADFSDVEAWAGFGMAASIEVTRGGRVWTVWAGGEDGPHAHLLASYSDSGGDRWREPVFMISPRRVNPDVPVGTRLGSLWLDPHGRLWLFFHQCLMMFDGHNANWCTRCDDPDADSPTWTEPCYIGFGASLNKPIVLRDNSWLLPVSLWERWHIDQPFADCYRELDAVRGANVFISDDEGESWRFRGGTIFDDSCFNEHSVVELDDGRLWLLSRCFTEAAQSFSHDGGRTWSPQSRAFPHANSRCAFRRLQSGSVLLVKHGQSMEEATPSRSHLCAFLCTDAAALTWSGGLLLDEREAVSYPDVAQAPDGSIYVHYDRGRATVCSILLILASFSRSHSWPCWRLCRTQRSSSPAFARKMYCAGR